MKNYSNIPENQTHSREMCASNRIPSEVGGAKMDFVNLVNMRSVELRTVLRVSAAFVKCQR